MSDDLVPLDHAEEALSDAVMHFHNDMLRAGIKELSIIEWGDEFKSWFRGYDLKGDYERTIKFLAECAEREQREKVR